VPLITDQASKLKVFGDTITMLTTVDTKIILLSVKKNKQLPEYIIRFIVLTSKTLKSRNALNKMEKLF